MRLLTVGDSFTYGEELADNRSAWPNLLANKCGYEVTNLGRPGESNTGILRNAMLNVDNADIVIIAWSHYARMEMSDENGVFTIWPGNAGNLFNGSLSYRHDLLKHINHHHDDFLWTRSPTRSRRSTMLILDGRQRSEQCTEQQQQQP